MMYIHVCLIVESRMMRCHYFVGPVQLQSASFCLLKPKKNKNKKNFAYAVKSHKYPVYDNKTIINKKNTCGSCRDAVLVSRGGKLFEIPL